MEVTELTDSDEASVKSEVESEDVSIKSESNSEAEGDSQDGVDKEDQNFAWADAISKVLKSASRSNKKTVVLSRAKLLTNVKKTGDTDVNGVAKTEEVDDKDDVKPNADKLLKLKKKEKLNRGRTKPNVIDREKERALMKIATKGVVQLFNAVRQQQVTIQNKIKQPGTTEAKKDRVLKSVDKKAFLDVLMGNVKNKNIDVSDVIEVDEIKEEEQVKTGATWDVLRDDFMMGAKLKDWDKTNDTIVVDE